MLHLKNWTEIPKAFRVSLIVSLILVLVVAVFAGIIKDFRFGIQTAITGGFSVTLLGVYVICVGATMAGVKSAMADGPNEAAANAAVMRIMVMSLVRLFILAAVLIICVVFLHFSVYAAIIGVSGVYLPLLVVPHFVKSEPDESACDESVCNEEAGEIEKYRLEG